MRHQAEVRRKEIQEVSNTDGSSRQNAKQTNKQYSTEWVKKVKNQI